MPFVQISLSKTFSQEIKDNISIVVHHSLIQEFNIPQDDYFHIIEELEPQQIGVDIFSATKKLRRFF